MHRKTRLSNFNRMTSVNSLSSLAANEGAVCEVPNINNCILL